jgi:hypothetical protein
MAQRVGQSTTVDDDMEIGARQRGLPRDCDEQEQFVSEWPMQVERRAR